MIIALIGVVIPILYFTWRIPRSEKKVVIKPPTKAPELNPSLIKKLEKTKALKPPADAETALIRRLPLGAHSLARSKRLPLVKLIGSYRGTHLGLVHDLDFSQGGRFAASATNSGEIKIWDPAARSRSSVSRARSSPSPS